MSTTEEPTTEESTTEDSTPEESTTEEPTTEESTTEEPTTEEPTTEDSTTEVRPTTTTPTTTTPITSGEGNDGVYDVKWEIGGAVGTYSVCGDHVTILDWKTGPELKPYVPMQTAAAARGAMEMVLQSDKSRCDGFAGNCYKTTKVLNYDSKCEYMWFKEGRLEIIHMDPCDGLQEHGDQTGSGGKKADADCSTPTTTTPTTTAAPDSKCTWKWEHDAARHCDGKCGIKYKAAYEPFCSCNKNECDSSARPADKECPETVPCGEIPSSAFSFGNSGSRFSDKSSQSVLLAGDGAEMDSSFATLIAGKDSVIESADRSRPALNANFAVSLGGFRNRVENKFGTIIGGSTNTVRGIKALAIGYKAYAEKDNAAVFAFNHDTDSENKVDSESSVLLTANQITIGGSFEIVSQINPEVPNDDNAFGALLERCTETGRNANELIATVQKVQMMIEDIKAEMKTLEEISKFVLENKDKRNMYRAWLIKIRNGQED